MSSQNFPCELNSQRTYSLQNILISVSATLMKTAYEEYSSDFTTATTNATTATVTTTTTTTFTVSTTLVTTTTGTAANILKLLLQLFLMLLLLLLLTEADIFQYQTIIVLILNDNSRGICKM